MGMSSLTAGVSLGTNWVAQNNLTGSDYSPITNSGRINKQQSYSTSVANAVLGGANEFVSYLISLANSANTTVNCQALTDILNTANVNLARVKGYMIRLLSPTDDATYGTNCSSISWGGAASNNAQFNLLTNDVNTVNTGQFQVFKGGGVAYCDQRAGGFTVDNTHKNLFFVNNDAGNAAKVQLSLVGGDS